MKMLAMVTTRGSWEYTSYALKSLFRKSRLDEDDRVYLIDNDESFEEDASWFSPQLEIIKNRTPLNFAANVNQIMQLAAGQSADLYFVNNDVIYTDDWMVGLLEAPERSIVSPFSNGEVQYDVGNMTWAASMKLSEYLGKETVLRQLVKSHRESSTGYQKTLTVPFFAVRLPHVIYSELGSFDEALANPDIDYCLHAQLAGFDVIYAKQSFVLNFNSKTTWSGGETAQESGERREKYRQAFEAKWGVNLYKLTVEGDASILQKDPEVAQLVEQENFSDAITKLMGKN